MDIWHASIVQYLLAKRVLFVPTTTTTTRQEETQAIITDGDSEVAAMERNKKRTNDDANDNIQPRTSEKRAREVSS